MIIAYIIEGDSLRSIELGADLMRLPVEVFWLDVIMPTKEDKQLLERLLLVNIPMADELGIIEVLNPLYYDAKASYMTVTVVNENLEGYLDSHPLVFILTSSLLITLRHTEIEPVRNVINRLVKLPKVAASPWLLLTAIVEMLIARIANVLDAAGNDLDGLMRSLFKKSIKNKKTLQGSYYNEIIERIGQIGSLISKNRESLVSLSRFVIFCTQKDISSVTGSNEGSVSISRVEFSHISREIASLEGYASFLDQRNGFLLEATLGLISVEQNTIMKIFALIAALFTPPMLVASIYGMNFTYMPELYTKLGYPAILTLIACLVLVSYLFFKKRGWF